MAYCRSSRALLNSILHGLKVFRGSDRSCRPTCFFFVAEAVVRKLCTQRSIVFRDGILPWRNPPVTRNIQMQTKLPLCDGYRFAVFKKTSTRRTRGVEGPTAPWQLKLQNLMLPMVPLPWQLDALPSYTSRSKNVRFHWRTLYNEVDL